MNKILYLMKNSSFFRSITTLASGSFIAQIITVLVSPITTRIFTPEQLGLYTLLITGLGIFGSVICLRYDLTIVTEEEECNVYPLVVLSIILTVVMSIIVSIGYYFYLSSNNDYKNYMYACLFLLFLLITTGITNVLVSYNNRLKEYKLMTQVYVIRTISQNILMIILGFLKFGVLGLLSSQLFSQFISLKRQASSLNAERVELKKVTWEKIRYVFRKHRNQFIYSTPAGLANNVSYSALNIFINFLFGSAILGFYSLSYRILGMPLTLISNNVSKVFFEQASREYEKNGNYKYTFIKTMKFLTVIAVLLLIVLEILPPMLFPFVFGKSWIIAAYYIQILAPLFAIRFIVSSVSTGIIISKRQKIDFLIQGLFIVFSIITVLIVKFFTLTIYAFLTIISVTYSLTYMVYLFYVMRGARSGEI